MATSKYIKLFQTSSRAPLVGASIWLVPQQNSYPTGALALSAHGSRPGVYFRNGVDNGEYKIYIDTAGGASPSLYEEHLWIGENKVSVIASQFDALGRLGIDGTLWVGKGKNLFNVNSAENATGHYVSWADGNVYANAAYNASHLIPVVAGSVYTITFLHWLAWYDTDGVFLSGYDNSGTSGTKTLTAPVGASFARFDCFAANWTYNQFELGSQATAFEEHHYLINGVNDVPVKVMNGRRELFSEVSGSREIAVPAIIHILRGVETTIYYDSIVSLKAGESCIAQLAAPGGKAYDRFFRITPAATGNINATISLYDLEFNLIASRPIVFVVTSETHSTAVNVLSIGDSYTYAGMIQYTMANKVPALTLVGMRQTGTGLHVEGRGGWTLAWYTSVKTEAWGFSPFVQPGGSYKYFGSTAFWKNVYSNPTGYYYAGFEEIRLAKGISGVTGFVSSPAVHDCMYDSDNLQYVAWSGAAWVPISEEALDFSFDFAKYLSVWGIASPDIVTIMLGVNDFYGCTAANFDTYWEDFKEKLDGVIASIRSWSTSVKIGLLIQPAGGSQDAFADSGLLSLNYKFVMWRFYRSMVENYDALQSSNTYLVDTASCLDRVYGISYGAEELPFALYTGAERVKYQNNNVHPTADGYASIGERLAGWIQYFR